MIDVGLDDPFIWSNRILHAKLLQTNVPHEYVERPGKYEWAYWIDVLPYHLQYISDRLRAEGLPVHDN